MKTTDVFFKSTNFVGREIENVQDLVKALAAGMDIATEDECGYSTFYDKEVEDEDGSTTYVETEKTDEELFNEMKGDLDNGNILFAGFFLNCSKFNIVPAKFTLQSNVYVGQNVFTMDKNKIVKAKVEYISLASGDISQNARLKETTLYDTAEYLYYAMNSHRDTMPWDTKKRMMDLMKDFAISNFAIVKTEKGDTVKRAFGDLFATKEELVKHLMEE